MIFSCSKLIRSLSIETTITGLLRKMGFPHSLEAIRVNYHLFSTIYEMPHSKFRERPVFDNNEGSLKCTCGQVLGYKSKREEKTKLLLHYKNCSNPPEGFETIKPPRKGLTIMEQEKVRGEWYRKFHQ